MSFSRFVFFVASCMSAVCSSSWSEEAITGLEPQKPEEVKIVSDPLKIEDKKEPEKKQFHKGKVIKVHNSVTFSILDEKGKEQTLRLSEIATPYLDKFHGPQSLSALKELIENKEIEYEIVANTPKAKIVNARTGETNVSLFMVKNGHAWVSKRYGKDASLLELQEKAKQERIGLWANLPRPGHGSKGMRNRIHHKGT